MPKKMCYHDRIEVNAMDQEKNENSFWRFMRKLVDLMGANALWLLTTLPVITAGASACAFFYTVRHNLVEDKNHVWGSFWRGFKMNLRQATALTLIFLLLAVFFYGDIAAIRTLAETGRLNAGFTGVFYALLALLALYALWVLLYVSRFEDTTRVALKNAFVIAVSSLPTTLLMASTIALCALVCWAFWPALLAMPGAALWLLCGRADRIFDKYREE